MLVAPKYEGLDLPVHDSDAFVATDLDMRSPDFESQVLRDYTASTFVRAVMIQLRNLTHAPGSAAELLEKTDRELKTVAELCGALVVGYQWGLYPVHDKGHVIRRFLPAAKGLGGTINLPKDHILVAEVDVIKPASPGAEDEASRSAVRTGLQQYYEAGAYQLFDLCYGAKKKFPRTDQFIRGRPVSLPSSQPRFHLIDIEPRFRLTA